VLGSIIGIPSLSTSPCLRSRSTASGGGNVKQGTGASTVANLAMQYKGVVIAWHQKVLRPAIMPMRGDKFDKHIIILHPSKCVRFDYRHPIVIYEPMLAYDVPVLLSYAIGL
jgi:hypothetical protein